MALQLENLSLGNFQEWVERQEEKLENEFQRMQDKFTAQYRELQMLLDKNMEQTFTILEALWNGQRRSIYTQTETQRYKRQAEDLQTEIEELNRKVSSESSTLVSIMRNIMGLLMRVDTITQFYKYQNIHFDKSRLEALKRSIQCMHGHVLEKLPQQWEFYEDITFNPDNTNECLVISDDRTQVSAPLSKPFQTEETRFHILAEQCWREGKHYWEVDVENSCNWAVGIVELASGNQLPQKAALKCLGWDKRSWALESEGGELAVLHNNHLDILMQQDMKRLGVFLDMTKNSNQLTFYNVGRTMSLRTFCPRFKKNVFPAFSLWSAADKVQSLALCNLRTNPNKTEDAKVSDEKLHSESPCSDNLSDCSMSEPISFVDAASSRSLSDQISESDQVQPDCSSTENLRYQSGGDVL